jgi:formate dehydrogenase accessory protein FdhE
MAKTGWQERILRAKTLSGDYPFAAEILTFYGTIAEFQQTLYERIERAASGSNTPHFSGAVSNTDSANNSSRAAMPGTTEPLINSLSVIPSEAELRSCNGNSAKSRDLAFPNSSRVALPGPSRAATPETSPGRKSGVSTSDASESLQGRLSERNSGPQQSPSNASTPIVAGPPELSALLASFPAFLALVEKSGPPNLADAARQLRASSVETQTGLLNDFWDGPRSSGDGSTQPASPTNEFFARAFLQPYAAFTRVRAESSSNGYTGSLCPFCGRKPGVAVLRPLGDGGQRRLVCSFCLAEWEFRRIVCANCGEEDHKKLPVYTADQFPHVRVDCCEHCHRYLKTIDLTKTGLADPIVDELATIPLDLWAREHGYEKLELNLLQL